MFPGIGKQPEGFVQGNHDFTDTLNRLLWLPWVVWTGGGKSGVGKTRYEAVIQVMQVCTKLVAAVVRIVGDAGAKAC